MTKLSPLGLSLINIFIISTVFLVIPVCCDIGDDESLDSDDIINTLRFTQSMYEATIQENSVGKTYVMVDAKMGIYDDDFNRGVISTSQQKSIDYRILDGDAAKLFKAEALRVGDFTFLQIRTKSGAHVINREQQDVYRFVVKAIEKVRGMKERRRSTKVDVIVRVTDTNDLSPLFDPTVYSVNVPENVSIHDFVVKVSASDADVGANGEILYSLATPTEVFAIHPATGVVTLSRRISYAEQSVYQLEVHARDRGPVQVTARVSKAQLTINVVEVNQHPPTISLQELPSVVEHGKIGTVYAVIYVEDSDKGPNGRVDKMTIFDGDPDGYFKLEKKAENEYTLNVARTLDREEFPEGFNLTLVAWDKGRPARNSSRQIQITLQDTNDNAPMFSADFYNVSIEECLPPHTVVVRISSWDLDEGRNGETIYRILGTPGPFAINPFDGGD